MKLRLSLGGGKLLILITESLIQLIRSNGWFIQEQSKSLHPNVHIIHPIWSK